MRCWLAIVGAVALVAIAACQPTVETGQWTLEQVPGRANAMSGLSVVASGGGVTWAFGDWHAGKSNESAPMSLAFRRDSDGRWHETHMPDVGMVDSAVLLSPDDVWVLGQKYDRPIQHWDGERWTELPVGAANQPVRMTAMTAVDGQVWAAGSGAAVWWDGRGWVDAGLPKDALNAETTGVAGVAADDVWVLGERYSRPGPGRPCCNSSTETAAALHWDGVGWEDVELPSADDDLRLEDVTAVSADEAWAVGYRFRGRDGDSPVVLHWDGQAWSEQPLPDIRSRLHRVVQINGEVWAIGDSMADHDMLVLRHDGTSWRRIPATPSGEAANAGVLPDGRALIVGYRSTGPYRAEPLAATHPL
jgi:hypothetical protein